MILLGFVHRQQNYETKTIGSDPSLRLANPVAQQIGFLKMEAHSSFRNIVVLLKKVKRRTNAM